MGQAHRLLSPSAATCLLLFCATAAVADHPAGQHGIQVVAPHEIYRLDASGIDGESMLPGASCKLKKQGATGKVIMPCDLDMGEMELEGKLELLPSNREVDGVSISRVKVRGSFEGSMKVEGMKIEYLVKLDGKADVDPELGMVSVPIDLKQCMRFGGGKECQTGPYGSELLPMTSSDGSWAIDLDVVSAGRRKLGGTATATFPGLVPMVLEYVIEGRYDPDADSADLELIPQNKKRANSLSIKKLRVVEGQVVGGKVVYDLWGHDGKARIAPPVQ